VTFKDITFIPTLVKIGLVDRLGEDMHMDSKVIFP
jgi:hypothetical protein